ncbi:MAG: Flp family type IVb pilin [Tepidanaerobacteraceae bacterium]|jgi:pilus assembly protein Flp/PilA
MFKQTKNILTQQDGQGLAEYALILALVALAAFAALQTLGGVISAKLDEVASSYP